MTEKKKDKFLELRKINVNEFVEKKGKFSYLSWACALDLLLEHDPDATWEYKEPMKFNDGTAMVFCTVTAFGKSRTMQLPVLNYQNKAIQNPSSFDLNTAMQRCLAKAIACHGIGLYIYKGEDLPEEEKKANKEKAEKKDPLADMKALAAKIKQQLEASDNLDVLNYVWNGFKKDLEQIKKASPDKAYPALEKLYKDRIAHLSQAPLEE